MSIIDNVTQRLLAPSRPTVSLVVRCLSYFSDDGIRILQLLGLMTFSLLAGLLQAWPLAVLVDTIAAPGSHQGWVHRLFLTWLPESSGGKIAGLALIALGLGLAQQVSSTAQSLLQSRINYAGVLRMRHELFRRLQAMHLDFHCSRPLGDTIFRLTTDTFGCQAVLGVLIGVAFAVVRITIILILLLPRSLILTAMALLIVPPLVWANFRFGRTLAQRTLEAKEADSAFLSFAHRALAAIGLAQAYGREDDEYHRFGSAARGCVRSWRGINRQEAGYGFSVGAILGTGGALILGYGGYLAQQKQLTPGDLMVFMAYLSMMYDPLCQLTGAGVNLQSGLASAKRVFEMLAQYPTVCDGMRARSLPLAPRRLTLDDVGFQYASSKPLLENITVDIPPGKTVAFVGASGVGKSTLLSLLPRFYDPSCGRILLDGWDLRSIRLKDVRKHIAFALQDSIILPTDIWENIAYGKPSASEAEVRAAAALAGAAEFIEHLPESYRTGISERGTNLSGGQCQRIAIARALLTDAPILVLDEPTSAQDTHQEENLRQTIVKLKGNRTVILVSHRISTIKDCDLICVLAEGTIKESGTHEQLLARNGIYARLADQGDTPLSNAA